MKKLKIILLFSLSLILFYRYYSISNYKSIYENKISTIEGIVTNIKTKDNTTSFILKTKENILVKYYDKIKLNVGDIIKVKGEIITPESNRVFNLFNYKKYLLSKKIYKYIQATEIKKIGNSKNFLFTIRRKLDKRLSRINNSYLAALILANNTIDNEIYATYQNNGISHLFAISGMHIAIFSSVLLFIFNKLFINRKISHYLTFILLLIYMFIIFTPSVIRSVLSFIFIKIKKIYNIQISSIQILILICYLMILYNPYYIYDTAFKYSFIISFGLIMFNNLYKDKNYLCKSLLISLLSFVFSFPITINNNFSINLLSPLLNLIFVPMISIILFPLSLITLIIPKLNIITVLIFNIFENISIFFDKYSIIINFGYINILTTIIYYIFLYFLLKNIKLYKIILFLIFLFLLNNNTFYDNYRLTVIDVGQGDSLLLQFKNTNVFIDTGGNIYKEMTKNIFKPYFNSINIKKINYLVLTHGDYDHMGESINLVENFKVEKVIFNCGEFNELENELIKVLDKKKIPYYSCIKELNIDDNKLYFLNNKDYGNENDNSSVIYTELNNYKFLFMGDAGVKVEEDLIEKYNLQDIDVLKVGHHGSRTSSSKNFIESIQPKYGVISVGKNNRYGHPNDSVLNNLDDSKIYRTDQDGSIMFKIKNNKLEIETCTP